MSNRANHKTTRELLKVYDAMNAELKAAYITVYNGGTAQLNELDANLYAMLYSCAWQAEEHPKPMSMRMNVIIALLRIQLKLEKGLG